MEESIVENKLNKNSYKIAIPLFILTLVLCLLIKLFGVRYDVLSVIYVTSTSSILIFYILNSKNDKNKKLIFLLAFIVRIIGMYIDLYVFRLPHAGSDDDGFYNVSLKCFNGDLKISANLYGGIYTKFLYFIYLFIGSNRLGAQFTNVLFSMISIIYFSKILDKLSLSNKSKNLGILLISFMPNLIFLNSILRRDTLITLLAILSINKFLDWYQLRKIKYAIVALLYILIASAIHSAMIFVFFMYLFIIFMYNKKKDKIDFSGFNFTKALFSLCFIVVIGIYLFQNVNSKFSKFTEMDALYETVSNTKGGSAYLTSMKVETLPQLIMFLPFKFVYFLFSPMPWDFRNVMDMFTFAFDGAIYLYLFYICIRNKKEKFAKVMFYVFIPITLVFSLGTSASGTAVRHRYNVLPFLLVSACCILDEKSVSIQKNMVKEKK